MGRWSGASRRSAAGCVPSCFWQGEADARAFTPGDQYEAALRRLGADLKRDCGTPLVAVQIGDFTSPFDADAVDGIRLAQQRSWGLSNVVAGPALYDIDLEGSVHFSAADDMATAAVRWTAAILGGVLGRSAGAAPELIGATWDGGREIELAVGPGSAPLTPGLVGGFTVRSAGVDVPVESALVESGGTVRLTLAVPATGQLTVSLGRGRTGAGVGVPSDPSPWRLPMLPFVDMPVAASD